ncbi:hypothetical protein G4228_014583 [Cervus hanglu yarkandensis]|nr:hypothetical protein G4228_014583 [Cervus hanglu yarkandensis]
MSVNKSVTEFIFFGLTQDVGEQKAIFGVFLVLYLATLLGNFLIVVIIKTSRAIVQVFSFRFFGCLEIFILVLMAVDCYVAICKPLHYTTLMIHQVCSVLVAVAWVGSTVHSLAQIFLALSLAFCGPNVIDLYLCDLQPLLQLACPDTYVTNLLLVSSSGTISTVSFVILMLSYAIILHSLRNHSAEGRKKALSTCISHIIVVILFFGPCIFIYTHPVTTFSMDKMIAVFYTLETPLINPLIYTLRNAEVKNTMLKLWSKKLVSMTKDEGKFQSFLHSLD